MRALYPDQPKCATTGQRERPAEIRPRAMLAVLVAVFHSVAAIEGARPSLHTLMTVAKSDKATVHQYTLHYEWLLGHLRDAPINFLEIGACFKSTR